MMAVLILPCADAFETNDFQQHKHSEHLTEKETQDQNKETDFCSPFCLCHCCGVVSGVVLQKHVFSLEKVKIFDLTKPEIFYNPIFISRYLGEIWQPPKKNI